MLRSAALGALIGACACGLGPLAFITVSSRNYFHEVGEQSPLSIMVLGAVPGLVLGLIGGLVHGAVNRKK